MQTSSLRFSEMESKEKEKSICSVGVQFVQQCLHSLLARRPLITESSRSFLGEGVGVICIASFILWKKNLFTRFHTSSRKSENHLCCLKSCRYSLVTDKNKADLTFEHQFILELLCDAWNNIYQYFIQFFTIRFL